MPTIQLNWLQPHEGNLDRLPVPRAGVPDGGSESDADVNMRILSITAGAAGMYCGSCSRDNALAVELLRARPRRHAAAALHADQPRRDQRQPRARAVRRHQHLPAAVPRRSSARRRASSIGCWDSPWVINAFASRSLSTDPRLLGDLTISMLEGDRGVLRKEFDKLLEWLADEPVPDVDQPAELAADRAGARRCGEALKRPICCTLQGEDLFLDGLIEPYRSSAIDLIRAQVADVDRFLSVSDYYVAGHVGDAARFPPSGSSSCRSAST